MQIMWKKARKIGCARGGLYGEPWYVAHYDQAPISQKQNTVENIERPKQVMKNYYWSISLGIKFTLYFSCYCGGKIPQSDGGISTLRRWISYGTAPIARTSIKTPCIALSWDRRERETGGVVSETFGHITIYLLNRMTVSGSKMIRHSLRSWLTCNMSKTRIRFSGLITTDDESFELWNKKQETISQSNSVFFQP